LLQTFNDYNLSQPLPKIDMLREEFWAAWHTRSDDVEDAAMLTRGFENVVAVARVNHAEPRGNGRSALGNWCNDMIVDGCANGQTMLVVGPQKTAATIRASFSIADLRAQRANGIWGDGK
jgi:predicted amidohydrolase